MFVTTTAAQPGPAPDEPISFPSPQPTQPQFQLNPSPANHQPKPAISVNTVQPAQAIARARASPALTRPQPSLTSAQSQSPPQPARQTSSPPGSPAFDRMVDLVFEVDQPHTIGNGTKNMRARACVCVGWCTDGQMNRRTYDGRALHTKQQIS